MSEDIEVVVNGRARPADPAWTIADLLESLGFHAQTVVVEHNGEALERERFSAVRLGANDRIEVVRAVAGG